MQGFPLQDLLFVMESTGNFWEVPAVLLAEKGTKVSVVNPRFIRDFCRSLNRKGKTDALDARVIARYGVRMKPLVLDLERLKSFGKLQHLVREREKGVRERTRLGNWWQKAVEQEIRTTLAQDETFRRKREIPDSIPGVGWTFTLVMLAEIGGFTGVEGGKEVVSSAGFCPEITASGRKKGHRGIYRKGNRRLGGESYLAAVASMRSHTGDFRTFVERLVQRGKTQGGSPGSLGSQNSPYGLCPGEKG
ncbi:MAG: IS110 family transposase [Candidatus Caldatribacteriaceae bacterium]